MRDALIRGVMCADAFGHTYERYFLAQALAKRPNVSPLTNAPYPDNRPSVRPNLEIKAAADAYLQKVRQTLSHPDASTTYICSNII